MLYLKLSSKIKPRCSKLYNNIIKKNNSRNTSAMHSSGEFFTCGGKVNVNELHLNRISNSLIKTEIEDSFSPQDDRWFIENLTLFGRCVPGATAALDLKHWTMLLE